MMKKNKITTIAYISGTRADFGLMTSILSLLDNNPKFKLHIYATGMHLMSEFGYTLNEVKKFFPNVRKLDATIKNDSREAITNFFSSCLSVVTNEFILHRPDMVIVLGDRPEMLSVACACLYLGIPIAHIHGGDITTTIDEITRHTITKLSHIHFAATQDAALRIRQMGEEQWRVHVVGAPSLDIIGKHIHLSKKEVYRYLDLPLSHKYIFFLLHPETSLDKYNAKNIKSILSAVKIFNLPIVVVYPNADPGNTVIIREIEKNRSHPLFHIYKNIPYPLCIDVIKYSSVWIGNSSAGIIESPSLHVPVVNIGSRQDGRIKAQNILSVPYKKNKIIEAIKISLTDGKFLQKIIRVQNPWGDGHTATRIVRCLEKLEINEKLLIKKFIDN